MAAVDIGAHNNLPAPTDDIDDLFNYDVAADLLRAGDDVTMAPNELAKASLGDAVKERMGGLGIDTEIKVTKRRAPVAKLDENKLLSQAGIPKLRTLTKERLKFKGKGHEYSDVARLLNVYQLWLDDMYPRAKFVDGLAMIEKLGHTKRIQAMRKEWIKEGKPKDEYNNRESNFELSGRSRPLAYSVQLAAADANQAVWTQASERDDLIDDEVLKPPEALSKSKESTSPQASVDSLFLSDAEGVHDARPEDDLDALLAEDDMKASTRRSASEQQDDDSYKNNDNFADEMEAMAGLDEIW